MLENVLSRFSGWRGLAWLCMVLALCAASCTTASAQSNATVDFNTVYQTFEGWGTSLAWWANVVGGYPDAVRNDYMARVFDPVYGLGLNIVRYNIGGGENPQHLSPNRQYLQYRANMPGFLAAPGAAYDWKQDANQRWVLQRSFKMGVTIAEAFSNSPPWWMTKSGSVTGAVDGGNNLNPAYERAFADYLVRVVQHYHDAWGITFRTLEPFNEPAAGWWKLGANQEGCGFDAGAQNHFVPLLGTALAASKIKHTSVSASDENSIDAAVTAWNAMDSTSLKYLIQANTHSYNGSMRGALKSNVAAQGKRLWMSEYGDNDASGLTMATRILADMKGLQPTGWIYWQAVDSGGGWGFLKNALDASANSSYTINKKYFVMGNFSKFIRPGYRFIGMDDPNSLAAYDRKGTLVIVTVNAGDTAKEVDYKLLNISHAMGTGPWNVQAYRTSAHDELTAQPVFQASRRSFTQPVPARSVSTFVITRAVSPRHD